MIEIELSRAMFNETEFSLLRTKGIKVDLFRYRSGVEAVRIGNARGSVIVLPFMGGMVWDATFDGVRLGMDSMFPEPRPSLDILGTYGCLLYHAGMLRNGNPGPADDHALHGEMPCARMDSAALELGNDDDGPFVRLRSRYDHRTGFGAHYRAEPTVLLRPGATAIDIGMAIRNEGGRTMDLMYMAHANLRFINGAVIEQSVPWTPAHVAIRRAVPGLVQPDPDYLALLDQLGADPAQLRVLDQPELLAQEQVFYLRGLMPDADGRIAMSLRRPEGDSFQISWPAAEFSHCVRWLLVSPDERVAAIALPSTCEPEGYAAETRKGNVRHLQPGTGAVFSLQIAYATAP